MSYGDNSSGWTPSAKPKPKPKPEPKPKTPRPSMGDKMKAAFDKDPKTTPKNIKPRVRRPSMQDKMKSVFDEDPKTSIKAPWGVKSAAGRKITRGERLGWRTFNENYRRNNNMYVGKYYGPDQFKGDKAKIDAWKKAGRPRPKSK